MLSELRIRNVAIIESVTLALAPGFNVLTGETGAGKSIVVESLGLLCGERAHADVVRTGAEKATVEGVFDLVGTEGVKELLDERGIDPGDDVVVLKREVTTAGRSRAWVNGTTVTTSVLAEVGAALFAIHGQHATRGLVEPQAQQALLDAYGGHHVHVLRVGEAFAALRAVRSEIEELTQRRDAAAKRADYLKHVVQEIEAVRIVEGEDERLQAEHRRLANTDELRQHTQHAIAALDAEEQGALGALAQARKALAASAKLDPALTVLGESLDAALVQAEEVARELSHYSNGLEGDPERLAHVERRRDLLFRVAKKYGGTLGVALGTLAEAKRELDLLDSASLDLGALSKREAEASDRLSSAARDLSAKRAKAAKSLGDLVGKLLPALGMADGRFTVRLTPRDAIESTGAEGVEFFVTLNAGHDARPLSRVASGGELSRVMLAIQSILARRDRTPTLVFDEVDAGIGGAIALRVGDAMRSLAEHRQVLSITHLAQIAAKAHHHVVVAKGARAGVTTADLSVVEGPQRVEEVARMLGGSATSAAGLEHARTLLAEA